MPEIITYDKMSRDHAVEELTNYIEHLCYTGAIADDEADHMEKLLHVILTAN